MATRYVNQPQRKVIKTRNGDVVLDWDPTFASRWNTRYNRAQRYVDAQVLYRSEDFLPVDTGALILSGRRNTRIGSGEVVWKTSYARPIYYGRRAKGRTGKKVSKGFRWFARMKKVSGQQIVRKGTQIAGGGENG
jgi:hypothetical protein